MVGFKSQLCVTKFIYPAALVSSLCPGLNQPSLLWFTCLKVFSSFLFKRPCCSEQQQWILNPRGKQTGITSFQLAGLTVKLQWLKVRQDAATLKIDTTWAQNTWYNQSEPATVLMKSTINTSRVCHNAAPWKRARREVISNRKVGSGTGKVA